MFVGDSLGRNQWESLICMTWSTVQEGAIKFIRGDPLSTFKFLVNFLYIIYYFVTNQLVDLNIGQVIKILFNEIIEQDYEVDVSFYRAPYLVDIDSVGSRRVLKLEEIVKNSRAWITADVLLFNTGHWWTHKGSLQGLVLFSMYLFYIFDQK